jgi:hypothetical protein
MRPRFLESRRTNELSKQFGEYMPREYWSVVCPLTPIFGKLALKLI